MKRIFALLLVVVMICGAFTACKKDEGKTFTLGFDAEFPPYGYKDADGSYKGFDLDLASEVCTRRGWTVKFQPIDWDSKDMELNSGNIDCIWNGFTMSNDRLDTYTWSEAYVDNSQVFAVATESGIKQHSDLAGKTIVVQAASSALEALNSEDCAELKASFKEIIEVPDYNSAFLYLQSGMADAVALDVGVAKYQIAERGSDKYQILDQVIVSELYGIGFKLGNTALRDEVQTTLNEMSKDGKFLEIAKKWDLQDSVVLGK